MGTRADFYVGRGKNAEWLSSVSMDGYPDAIPRSVKGAKTEADFRAAVDRLLDKRGRYAADGWPWPWDDSRLTDYSYAFDEGRTWACKFAEVWFYATRKEPEYDGPKRCVFPDMSKRRNLLFDGMIVVAQ